MNMDLRECHVHGPFRGTVCPVCGMNARLLMGEREVDKLSKILAGMLRHFPERYGVRLDEHGWVRISDIVPPIRMNINGFRWLTPEHVETMIKTEERDRYQLDDTGRVRARYGHTIPVNMDDLPTDNIPDSLYYQTTPEEDEFIQESGISPSDKTWIHLSGTYRKAYFSGLFHVEEPKIIGVRVPQLVESGMPVYRATDDIYLVASVPGEFLFTPEKEEIVLSDEEKEMISIVKEKREQRKDRQSGFDSY